MYERKNEPVATYSTFIKRVIKSFLLAILIIIIALSIGIAGYHHFEKMNWLNAFLNASMVLSDMGLATPLTTPAGKLFASFYALFSGLMFATIMAVIFAPIIHRFIHIFHSNHERPLL